jgi:hypothetical protein
MIKFLKKYIPYALVGLLVLQAVSDLMGVPLFTIQLVNLIGIIGWISYIEVVRLDTEA